MKKIKMIGHNMILNYLTFKERLEYTIGEPKSVARYLIMFDPDVSKYYLIDGISGDVLRTTSSLNELLDFMHSQSPGLVTLHNIKSNEVSDYKPDFVYFFVDEGKFVNLDLSSLNIEGTTVIDSSRVLQNIASIGQTLTPSADNTVDLGSTSYRWRNGHFAGTVDAGSLNLGGTTVIDSSRRLLNVSDIRFSEGEYSNIFTYGSVIGFFNPDIRSYGDTLQFYPPDSAEYLSGGTWYSISVPKDIFMGAKHSTFVIRYGWEQVRFTWTNLTLRRFEALYMHYSTLLHKMIVEVQRSADGTNWETVFTSGQLQGWPAHFTHVKFWSNANYPFLRIVITPIWDENYPNYDIYIYNIRYFVSYPIYAGRKLYDWDANRNVTFYGYLLPFSDNTYDLGSSTKRWRNGHFAGTVDAGSLKLGGTTVINSSRVLQNIASVAQTLTPSADNTYDLGSSTLRWRNLYAVNVNTGDVIFQNDWKITEYDESGQLMNGLRILNRNGKEIFKITEDGLYFKGKKIA